MSAKFRIERRDLIWLIFVDEAQEPVAVIRAIGPKWSLTVGGIVDSALFDAPELAASHVMSAVDSGAIEFSASPKRTACK